MTYAAHHVSNRDNSENTHVIDQQNVYMCMLHEQYNTHSECRMIE